MKLSILMKSGFLGILIVSLSVSYVGAQAGRFQEVLNAAKKEAASSALVVYASNPREEKTRQALFDAFKKNTGCRILNSSGSSFIHLWPCRAPSPRWPAPTRFYFIYRLLPSSSRIKRGSNSPV